MFISNKIKAIVVLGICMLVNIQSAFPVDSKNSVFEINQPDFELSPYTGMTRKHWMDAAHYLLEGAFSYIHNLDDPMKFPKQLDKTYPRNESAVATEKLEGLCRTLFVAAPLLKENPDLKINGIGVADYYRHQIIRLTDPASDTYIKPYVKGASQTLVELGGLAISLAVIPEIIWHPLSQENKDALAETMLGYAHGKTIDSNWRFFNIFILSFFKEQGYTVNEKYLIENIEKTLEKYRGQGWYNDSPAYDYYSMWAFQTYGPLWAELFGKKLYPKYADKYLTNQYDLVDNYPYMFSKEGKMNMWGRSICYRFAAIAPLPLLVLNPNKDINWGWIRRIASSTLLQFLTSEDFLNDRIPCMGFYKTFAPAVQIYSCRGSVYWCGKAFLGLLFSKDSDFWKSTENNGPWEKDFKKGNVYNKFQPGTNLMITDYPDCGGSEMRSWCHEKVADDWQKFRSSENYNKLAYHTEFPWMADGDNGEISMNYGIINGEDKWEVLRLYTFMDFKDGIYRRNAVLETNDSVTYQLADIPLHNGVLRVDKVTVPFPTKLRLGHYSLPETTNKFVQNTRKIKGKDIQILSNGSHSLAMVNLYGWDKMDVLYPSGLHPVSERCGLIYAESDIDGSCIFVTLQLWKNGTETFTENELSQVKSIKVSENKREVTVIMSDNSKKTIVFE